VDPAENIPGFTKTDRLGLTAFVSVLAHMTLVLGVGFSMPELRSNDPQPTLDITLINTRADSEPDEADFLAQANQEGGGNRDEAVIAGSPLPVPVSVATTADRIPALQSTDQPREPRPAVPQPITQDRERVSVIDEQTPQEQQRPSEPVHERDDQPVEASARERARLSAEITDFWQQYQKRPRRKFLNARTREYKYAEYMEKWRRKVERVGNLNYPEKARQENLTGSLVLDVAINPDGSVHNLNLIKSSGQKILDDAARRIVRLASPYEPFPADIKKEVDILHITRSWQFMRDNRLTSR